MVIEVPPQGERAQLLGSIINAWQRPLADVGPSGEDAGKGRKYLIVPPKYEGVVPSEGYIVLHSDTAAVHFAFRPVAINGGSLDDQSAYAQTVRVYPLADPGAVWPFIDKTGLMIDKRAFMYFYVTYLPKTLGGGTYYISGLRDSAGELLNGKDSYRLRVPADTPAEDFWSVIVYSMKTKGFVEHAERVGLASTHLDRMRVNHDGSVDIDFSPQAPEGREDNWIPTGEDWFILFRLYGPKKGWFESGWQLPDIEKLE